MLSKSERAKAAQVLIEAERTKKQAKQLSVTFPKIDIDDAYAIQQEVTKQKLKAGRKVIGHKIGLTSK
ncbi:MAG: 2-oxo-hepta-3-ene-1,7-dioate hydratase, partial [Xanthobacteraceae bacterium]